MIRDYTNDDFLKCVEIVNLVWAFDAKFKPQQLSELFQKIYTGGSLSASNFSIVYEENSIVKGFLFGKSGNNGLFKNEYSGVWGNIRFLYQLLFLKGVTFKKKFYYLRIIGEHEKNRRKIEPLRENEVNLFALAPKTQGKGYGKLLMNAFIEYCNTKKVNRITLETDSECNYRFYEHFGFKIKGKFYSALQKEYSGKSGYSYIYELKL